MMVSMYEIQLCQRANDGQGRAFDELVELYRESGLLYLTKTLRQMNMLHLGAEDTMQEANLKLWLACQSNRLQLKPALGFGAYYFACLHHQALDTFRREKKEHETLRGATDCADAPSADPSPLDVMVHAEHTLAWLEVLESLPGKERELVELMYSRGVTAGKASKIVGVARATGYRWITKARQLFSTRSGFDKGGSSEVRVRP